MKPTTPVRTYKRVAELTDEEAFKRIQERREYIRNWKKQYEKRIREQAARFQKLMEQERSGQLQADIKEANQIAKDLGMAEFKEESK